VVVSSVMTPRSKVNAHARAPGPTERPPPAAAVGLEPARQLLTALQSRARYHSPLRQAQAAATRERILMACASRWNPMELGPGGHAPLHVHHDIDDSFYLLSGRIAVRCGEDELVAQAGDYVSQPKGVPHTFFVLDGKPAVILANPRRRLVHELHQAGRSPRH
jgi:mannose-6-phosphate isomerase-like protein (cupin superfamily)